MHPYPLCTGCNFEPVSFLHRSVVATTLENVNEGKLTDTAADLLKKEIQSESTNFKQEGSKTKSSRDCLATLNPAKVACSCSYTCEQNLEPFLLDILLRSYILLSFLAYSLSMLLYMEPTVVPFTLCKRLMMG